jgi:competence protein ComEA
MGERMQNWLEQNRGVLFFALVAAAMAGLALFQTLRPEPDPAIVPAQTPETETEPTATPGLDRVYVSGAVVSPDVYGLPSGSIVKDALHAAGGPAADADLDRINLAAPVTDGQQVYVPHQGEEALPVQLPATRHGALLININLADVSALETLPGIGPALAQRIVDYRDDHGPFTVLEDIMEVSGIGPATFEGIRDLITTE